MGERPAEIYEYIGPRVLHVQVKDARRSAGHKGGWQLVPMGEGEVPVREIIGLLAAGGYGGYISVEWEKYWHPEIEEAQIALPQHLKVLEEWYRTWLDGLTARGVDSTLKSTFESPDRTDTPWPYQQRASRSRPPRARHRARSGR